MNNAVSVKGSEMMRIDQASVYTGIIKSRLYKMAMPKARKIATYKIGGCIFFKKADLDELLANSRRCSMEELEGQAQTYIVTHEPLNI